jgi:Zn-dependent peptidase ImmA (M78 family)
MRLSDETYESIKQEVINIFLAYNIKCIPINAFECAYKMGLILIPYSSLSETQSNEALKRNIDGFSVWTLDNKWIIYYNDACKNYGRINQTIMHEIAHYVLGHKNDDPEEEAEAKFFAKYSLAPAPLIHTMLENITPDSISDKFSISFEASCYAYNYYQKWLRYSGDCYTSYEKRLLEQFMVG